MGSRDPPYRETGMSSFGYYPWWAFCMDHEPKIHSSEKLGFYILLGMAFFLGLVIAQKPSFGLDLIFTGILGYICYKAYEFGLIWILEILFGIGVIIYFFLNIFGFHFYI